MSLYTTPYEDGAPKSTVTIFQNDKVLRNVNQAYCTYYTSGSNDRNFSNADAFLTNLDFSNVRSNVQSGLSAIIVANATATRWLSSNAGKTYTFSNSVALSNYMTQLKSSVSSLAFVANCVTEQKDPSEDLYKAKQELDVSKDRYEQLHSPETHVSYYEGTFPIYRPIGHTTMFVLFGLGLFLMLLSLLCFMRTQGIELHLVMPQSVTLPGISIFEGQGMYIGIASLVGIVLGYFLHIYMK
jgi:hypothetical protein